MATRKHSRIFAFATFFLSRIRRCHKYGLIILLGLAFASPTAQALQLEVTSSVDPVEDNTALTITMTVSNPSAVAQNNVVLQATTPAFMQFYADQQATPPGDCLSSSSLELCNPGDTIEWLLGTLAPGEVRVVRYSDVVSTSAADGELLVAEAIALPKEEGANLTH